MARHCQHGPHKRNRQPILAAAKNVGKILNSGKSKADGNHVDDAVVDLVVAAVLLH